MFFHVSITSLKLYKTSHFVSLTHTTRKSFELEHRYESARQELENQEARASRWKSRQGESEDMLLKISNVLQLERAKASEIQSRLCNSEEECRETNKKHMDVVERMLDTRREIESELESKLNVELNELESCRSEIGDFEGKVEMLVRGVRSLLSFTHQHFSHITSLATITLT